MEFREETVTTIFAPPRARQDHEPLTADGLQLTARENGKYRNVIRAVSREPQADSQLVYELYGLTEEEIGIVEGEGE